MNRSAQPNRDGHGWLALALWNLAVLLLLVGVALGAWMILRPAGDPLEPDYVSPQQRLLGGLLALAGLAAGALFGTLGWLARRQDQLARAIHSIRMDLRVQAHASPAPDVETTVSKAVESLRSQLGEIHEAALLSDSDRQRVREEQRQAALDRQAADVREAMDAGNLEAADAALKRLAADGPDDPRLPELRRRLEELQRTWTAHHIERQAQAASDLMSLARFDEAETIAAQLRQQFPDSPETETVLGRVRREAENYRNEQRTRLFAVIQEQGQARRWKQAVQAAHRLLDAYPDSDEAEQVRKMLSTLVDNARLQEVREYRDRILDLIDRRRYADAAALADEVIQNYPETAAAEELRYQLPRLREKAKRHPDSGTL